VGRAIQPVERFRFGAVRIADGQVRTAISPIALAACDDFSSRIKKRRSSAFELADALGVLGWLHSASSRVKTFY
jgi:hypothetical protein